MGRRKSHNKNQHQHRNQDASQSQQHREPANNDTFGQADLQKLLNSLKQLEQFQPAVGVESVVNQDHLFEDVGVDNDQLEQNHVMLQDFDRRLQWIERQVSDLSEFVPRWEEFMERQVAAERQITAVGATIILSEDSQKNSEANTSGLASSSVLGNWEAEREKMLQAIEDEKETVKSVEAVINETPLIDRTQAELESTPGVTPEDIEEISELKQRLQAMLRETEIELSIQRAKIRQERAQLEEQAAVLAQREKELLRRSEEGCRSKGVLGRFKNFLSHRSEDQS